MAFRLEIFKLSSLKALSLGKNSYLIIMIKTCLFLLFICTLQIEVAVAQTHAIDSLKKLLKNEKQDSTRCILLIKLCSKYINSKPDTALLLAQQGLKLAKAVQFTFGEAACLNIEANVFIVTGNDAKALGLFLQALKKAEQINNRRLQGLSLSNIGTIYFDQGDYKKCLQYIVRGKDIFLEISDKKRLLPALSNIGNAYDGLNQEDSARIYTNQAYDLSVQLADREETGIALNNLGNIYSKMNQPGVAMENYRMSIPYAVEMKNDELLCETFLGMAKLFKKQGQNDSSLYYAKRSFTIGQHAGFIQRELTAANFLAGYYRQEKNVDSAYKYLSAVITAKDSVFSQEKTRQLQSITLDEPMRQQDMAIKKSAEEHERHDNIQYAFMAVGLVSFTLLFLLLSNTVIVNEKWLRFFGVLVLLLVFEFINLYFHNYISQTTHHSPLLTLLAMVATASLLIPLHHRIEYWVTHKMVEKNKRLQLAAAKKTVTRLEAENREG